MNKLEQAANVKSVRAYLEGIGQPVSRVQGYEVVARALGYKSKHVLAQVDKPARGKSKKAGVPESVVIDGTTVLVRKLGDKALSVDQMKALNWEFDFVLPLSLEDAIGDIDRMNEAASLQLTGLDYALEDIGYEHVPGVNYGPGFAAYQVTGCVPSPAELFDFLEDSDLEFYANLLELANRIKSGAQLKVTVSIGGDHEQTVARVNYFTLGLLKAYAEGLGANNDEVNERGQDFVFEGKNSRGTCEWSAGPLYLHQLKYAVKTDPCTWFVSLEQHNVTLQFKD